MSLSPFAETIFKRTYAITPEETWEQCAARVARTIADGDESLERDFYEVISSRKFMPGGRYLYSCGRELQQLNNCFLLRAEDSREGWGKLLQQHVQALSTGGGVGTYYGDIRAKGTPIKRFGGESSGPLSLMAMINEVARHVMAGGKRRSALWAGLPWDHPDIVDFIKYKNWPIAVRALKEKDFNFPAPLDMTNISVCLDDRFFKEIKKGNKEVQALYDQIIKSMCKTGEPGLSVDLGANASQVLRNPCTEVVSSENADTCNLGSIVLPRIDSIEELKRVTRIAIRFLYMGTLLGWMPHEDFLNTRIKNRRVGLGLMGLHEWCLKKGLPYEPSGMLGKWLSCWANISDDEADKFSEKCGDVRPIAVRAIAPTGTIGIVAETTTGIEPVFCVAYRRRYIDAGKGRFSYVIDPTAERAVNEYGVDPSDIEDAYSLASNPERRIAMQAFVQDFVDQAISSTINLPEWGEDGNNSFREFGKTLLKYLPRLRGITVYPDGSRPGQPITAIKYETAKKHLDVVYEESDERCKGGSCGV